MKLPVDNHSRSAELYWNVEIPKGDHTLTLTWLNPIEGGEIGVRKYTEFDNYKREIEIINK